MGNDRVLGFHLTLEMLLMSNVIALDNFHLSTIDIIDYDAIHDHAD